MTVTEKMNRHFPSGRISPFGNVAAGRLNLDSCAQGENASPDNLTNSALNQTGNHFQQCMVTIQKGVDTA